MTRQQMNQQMKQEAKTEAQGVYKQKSQDHKGRFTRARAAKDSIRNIQGE